jgi:hypothetical protein
MKKYKYWKNFIIAMAMILIMPVGIIECAAAGTTPWNDGQEMSLTLDLKNPSQTASFSIYKIEAWTDGTYQKTAAFRSFQDDPLGNPAVSDIVEEAGDLQTYIEKRSVRPDRYGTTVQGRVTFDHLPAGLYLVAQRADVSNTITVTEDPYLILLPSQDGGGGYLYDVVSMPKYTVKSTADNSPDPPRYYDGWEDGDEYGGEIGDYDDFPETEPEETYTDENYIEETYVEETSSQPVPDPSATQEPTTFPQESDISYPTKPDGTPDVPPENVYDSIVNLPEDVNFDDLIPLGDGYYYDPVTGELYFILDQAVPRSWLGGNLNLPDWLGGNTGLLAKMGDSSVPSVALGVIAVVSGAGCIILYRRRKLEEEEH